MDVYVSTACIPNNRRYIDVIERYLANDIAHIELGSSHHHHAIRDEKALLEFPCRFLIHNYFPPSPDPFVLNLASDDPLIRKRSLDHVKHAIELSAALQAPFYSLHAGFITDPVGFGATSYVFPAPVSKNEEKESAFMRFASALEEAERHAQAHHLRLLVENNVCSQELQGRLLLQSADEFLRLFDVLGSTETGVLLDFGHLNVTATTLGFDRLGFIEQLTPHIAAFHVHDNDGLSDTHNPVEEDSWILRVLRRPGLASLPVIIEARFPSVHAVKAHADWLSGRLSVMPDNSM